MPELQYETDQFPGPATLELAIFNREPIGASELGDLLSAMGRDYEQAFPGQRLLVNRVADGSIFIWLGSMVTEAIPYGRQAVNAAKGAKALLDLAKAMRDLFKGSSKADPEPLNPATVDKFLQSAEKLARLAIKHNTSFSMQFEGPKGEHFRYEAGPTDAKSARRVIKARKSVRNAVAHAPWQEPIELDAIAEPSLASKIETMLNIPTSKAAPHMRQLVEALIRLDMTGFALDIGRRLDREGRLDLTDMLREELSSRGVDITRW